MTRGMLDGIRVVEFASENAAFAGKMLAGMGAEVILIEPPGGHYTRWFEPFAFDVVDPEGSLWWWHYNTGKESLVLDRENGDGELLALLQSSDILIEGTVSGEAHPLAPDYEAVH